MKIALIGLLSIAAIQAQAQECPILEVTGAVELVAVPGMGAGGTHLVCHTAYAAQVDLQRKIPRWVAYDLTGQYSLGCVQRTNNFHPEDQLASDYRARPMDYAKSGYDIGHHAPAQDMARSPIIESDSFSLANMAPQLPGLNRQGWEDLEQAVRDWSLVRGDLHVFVGPILGPNMKTIGPDKIVVPLGFWKVVYDPKTKESLSFIMPQQAVPKGDIGKWQVTLGDVENGAGISLPVDGPRDVKAPLWPRDDTAWHAAHKAACGSP